jgi:hypothetical protein
MADYVDLVSNMNLNDPNLRPNDGGFQAVEPGTYDFEIEKSARGVAKTSGKNALKVTARIVGPDDSGMLNRTMQGTYILEPDQFFRERLLCFLQGCGAQIGPDGFSVEALVGLRFTADVEKRPGKPTVNNQGVEVTPEFTSWVRERPVGVEVVQSAPAPRQTAPAPAAGNAPRRPAAPAGNGRPQQPR